MQRHLDDPDEVLDDVPVMTTSHSDESPDDAAFFFVLNTSFGNHCFEHYLVLHIGDGEARMEVDAAVRRYALDPLWRRIGQPFDRATGAQP